MADSTTHEDDDIGVLLDRLHASSNISTEAIRDLERVKGRKYTAANGRKALVEVLGSVPAPTEPVPVDDGEPIPADKPKPKPTPVPVEPTPEPTKPIEPPVEPAPIPTTWTLTANVVEGTITASFRAPKGFSGGVLGDVELYDGTGAKIHQWIDTRQLGEGETLVITGTPVNVPEGKYTIKLGAFKPDWSEKFEWNDNAGSFTPGPAPTPPPLPEPPVTALDTTRPNWLGQWSGDVELYVKGVIAANPGKRAVFIAYNIPFRDNGNYSAGGLASPAEYKAWIAKLAKGIGTNRTIVVVEPDALGLLSGLNQTQRNERISMLQDATSQLGALLNTEVFLDGSTWVDPIEEGNLLKLFPAIDGFSCNVSGYKAIDKVQEWAEKVSVQSGLKYVVDTSRNGNGNPHEPAWCNVTDTKVGVAATDVTNSKNCKYFLWLKVPGESDGLKINGYDGDGKNDRSDVPRAGERWVEYESAIYSGDWTSFKSKYRV